MLDSLCEPIGWCLLVLLMVRVAVLSVLVLLSLYGELDCEENKLEVRLFDKK